MKLVQLHGKSKLDVVVICGSKYFTVELYAFEILIQLNCSAVPRKKMKLKNIYGNVMPMNRLPDDILVMVAKKCPMKLRNRRCYQLLSRFFHCFYSRMESDLKMFFSSIPEIQIYGWSNAVSAKRKQRFCY